MEVQLSIEMQQNFLPSLRLRDMVEETNLNTTLL
jgi:hypothetical protein